MGKLTKDAIKIYRRLRMNGAGLVGACAMLANIYHECHYNSCLVEKAKSKGAGWTSESYTDAIDDLKYTKEQFCNDSYGYGLCQWTWHERKAQLYDYLKNRGLSIGDLEGQVDFLCREINRYYTPKHAFYSPHGSVEAATKTIMLKYEAPANQTDENQQKRVKTAMELWNELIDAGEVK